MKTILKLVTRGAVLACAGAACAGTPNQTALRSYALAPAQINPQPLPPLPKPQPQPHELIGASSGLAPSPQYPPGPVRTNPQPLPPLNPRPS